MKRIIPILLVLFSTIATYADTRIDSDGNTVYHPSFITAQYQMTNFDFPKESGAYGLGLVFTSISHWGFVHVGGNLDFSINAGLCDPWGCLIDFGPSVRFDINKNFYVNVPLDATCSVYFPEGTTDTKTFWGGKAAPTLHAFITDKFGLFAGPQVLFGDDVTFGMVAGISVEF